MADALISLGLGVWAWAYYIAMFLTLKGMEWLELVLRLVFGGFALLGFLVSAVVLLAAWRTRVPECALAGAIFQMVWGTPYSIAAPFLSSQWRGPITIGAVLSLGLGIVGLIFYIRRPRENR